MLKKTSTVVLFCLLCQLIHAQYLVPFLKDSLYGYANLDGEVVIQPEYDKVKLFNPKHYAVVLKDRKVFIIDSLGNKVNQFLGLDVPKEGFDRVVSTTGQFYEFKLSNHVGYLDSTFHLVNRFEGIRIEKADQGEYFIVGKRENGKTISAAFDSTHKMVLPFEFGKIQGHLIGKNRTVVFTRFNRAYDVNGKPVFQEKYDRIDTYLLQEEGFLIGYKGTTFDVYDEELTLVKGDVSFTAFKENPSVFQLEEKHKNLNFSKIFNQKRNATCWQDTLQYQCICMSKEAKTKKRTVYVNGEKILSEEYRFMNKNKNWNAIVFKKENKYGVMNYEGKTVLPPEFDRILSSSNFQNILVEKKDVFSFYLPDGKPLDQEKYAFANHFALKKIGHSKYALHEGTGIAVTEFIYDTLFVLKSREFFFAQKGKENVVLNQKGKVQAVLDIDEIYRIGKSPFWKVWKNDKIGVLNSVGEWVLKPQYLTVEKVNSRYLKPLFKVKKEDDSERLMIEKEIELDINIEETLDLHQVSRGKLTRIQLKDGTEAIFNSKGEKTLIIPKNASVFIDEDLLPFHLIQIDRVYANFETGVIYR